MEGTALQNSSLVILPSFCSTTRVGYFSSKILQTAPEDEHLGCKWLPDRASCLFFLSALFGLQTAAGLANCRFNFNCRSLLGLAASVSVKQTTALQLPSLLRFWRDDSAGLR
jgi:hypothetical protein